MNLQDRIIEELNAGGLQKQTDIAAKLGTTPAYVSVVKSRLQGNGKSWKRLREAEKLRIAYLFGVGDHSIYDLSQEFKVSMKQIEHLLGGFIHEQN